MHARENVADQVNSCQNDDQLDALGEMYFLHYICSFRIRKNEGSGSESPPYYSSFTTKKTKRELIEHILRTSGEPPQCSEEAKRRALVRDDFRCTLTGAYDFQTVRQNTGIKQEVMDSVIPTECVHIFPQSIAVISGTDANDAKHEHAASIWTIMTYLGFEDLPKKLAGNGIHSLENVMTLDRNFSCFFEILEIWFEAIDDQDNTYAIRERTELEGALILCENNPVTLTSQHPDLPLPNRTFLAIHAACCRIADLSGATTYLAKVLEGLDDMEDV